MHSRPTNTPLALLSVLVMTLIIGCAKQDAIVASVEQDNVVSNQPLGDDLPLPGADSGKPVAVEPQGSAIPLTELIVAGTPSFNHQDLYGDSLAVARQVLVSGAPGRDVDGNTNAGSVSVMFQVNEQWFFETELTAELPQANAAFGDALAVTPDGNMIAVAAPREDNAAISAGAVYLFERFGEGWVLIDTLVSPDPANFAHFGTQLLLHPDKQTLFIAERDVQGKVHRFSRNRNGWSWQQTLRAPLDEIGLAQQQADDFGQAMALSATGQLLIGSPGRLTLDEGSGAIFHGAVYSYRERQGLWVNTQTLLSEQPESTAFGQSLAVAANGSTLLVGQSSSGAIDAFGLHKIQKIVALYRADRNGQWQQATRLSPSGAHAVETRISMVISTTAEQIYLSLTTPGRHDNTLMRYDLIGDGWLRTALYQKEQPDDTALGYALALSPDEQSLIVSAPLDAGALYQW